MQVHTDQTIIIAIQLLELAHQMMQIGHLLKTIIFGEIQQIQVLLEDDLAMNDSMYLKVMKCILY